MNTGIVFELKPELDRSSLRRQSDLMHVDGEEVSAVIRPSFADVLADVETVAELRRYDLGLLPVRKQVAPQLNARADFTVLDLIHASQLVPKHHVATFGENRCGETRENRNCKHAEMFLHGLVLSRV